MRRTTGHPLLRLRSRGPKLASHSHPHARDEVPDLEMAISEVELLKLDIPQLEIARGMVAQSKSKEAGPA